MSENRVRTAPTLADLRARRDEILALAARYGATDVRVFGSVARGDAAPGSDIDFLVRFPEGYRLLHHAGLVAALEDLLSWKVDVSVEQNLRETHRASILRDTVPL